MGNNIEQMSRGKCGFCEEEISMGETVYVISWQQRKCQKWETVGYACESCGEENPTRFRGNKTDAIKRFETLAGLNNETTPRH